MAGRPGPARPGLLAPGLLVQDSSPGAVTYRGSSWLKSFPVPERKGSEDPTQPPEFGVSPEKLLGKVQVMGDTESQAAPPGAVQRAQIPIRTYA